MAGDPNYNSVSLLLDGNGTNGSTSIVDLSATPHTVTAVGNAQISTAVLLASGATFSFDGSGDYLSSTDADISNFGAGDFRVEMMVNHASIGDFGYAQGAAMGSGSSDKWWFGLESGNIKFGQHSTANSVSAAWTPTAGTWYYIVADRHGGVTDLYVDNTLVATSSVFSGVSFGSDGATIGGMTTPRYMDGNIAWVRITKGVSRGAVTKPTTMWPITVPIVSGIVRDSSNALCQRTVRAYDRVTGALVGVTTSNATTGVYTLGCATTNEVNIVCLDDAAGTLENDLILRTTPV